MEYFRVFLACQIDTVERDVGELRTVGYAAIHLFVDPRESGQPARKNLHDYVLNQVGTKINFQLPSLAFLMLTFPSTLEEAPSFCSAQM